MANKKVIRKKKTPAVKGPVDTGSVWLAGVGALSLLRKQGGALLGDLVREGHRLQLEASRFAREATADVQAQAQGVMTQVKARFNVGVKQAAAAVESGVVGVRVRLGVPSKADIDELSRRIGTLSRQLKAAK